MNEIVAIHIYPIKGMQGVSLPSCKTLERGLEHDRRYMLVDKEGTFISQRSHTDLVFFYPKIEEGCLMVNWKEDVFRISLSESTNNAIETTIFNKPVMATEVSQQANKWFSERLGEDVRLVKMQDGDIRHKKLIRGPQQVEVSFADGYPYLIAGTASLDLLNEKLDDPLSMNRFRPNIVVRTDVAHVEDSWFDIEVGKVAFTIIKACARCPVVTVDQQSGSKSKEPLKTMASYRKKENKVYFGANAICREEGMIHIGDKVVVL